MTNKAFINDHIFID